MPTSPPPRAPSSVEASNQIIAARAEGTAKELRAKGARAILNQQWREAADAFEALVGGDAASANDPEVIHDLGVAYEGLGEWEKARARFREVVARFPADPNARSSRVREVSLDGYLEDWKALGEVGDAILANAKTKDDPFETMLGLGARGLSRAVSGDDAGASRDVNTGLDLVDANHVGETGQLPVPAAILKFAQGEVRKARSEKVVLDPQKDGAAGFVVKLEIRCQGLLDAQASYADAIRSVDPHWATMSGYRVGEMYRRLHEDLMRIPPTDRAKTESDRQLFFGMMHVRYRVLLEKGIEMMQRTLDFGAKTNASQAWMKRTEQAKAEMEKSLVEEKEALAKLPFTEEEIVKALAILKKKADADAAKAAAKQGSGAK